MTTNIMQTGITAQISSIRVPTGTAVCSIIVGNNILPVPVNFVWPHRPTVIIKDTFHLTASQKSINEVLHILPYSALQSLKAN
jgi:hypothetical protein